MSGQPILTGRRREIVERAIEWFNAGDFNALADAVSPDFVWRPAIGTLESREYRGRDGMREYERDIGESLQGLRFETESVRVVDDATVVVLGRLHATGHRSGASVSGERGIVARFEGDRIASMVSFPSQQEALEAARRASGERHV